MITLLLTAVAVAAALLSLGFAVSSGQYPDKGRILFALAFQIVALVAVSYA